MASQIDALFARAESAFRRGQHDAASGDLRSLLRMTGDHPNVLHLLALAEQGAGRSQDAGVAFLRALKVAPNDPQINNNYANFLGDIGDDKGALHHYERALHRGEFVDALLNRALLHERHGRLQLAESDIRRVIAATPSRAVAYTILGNILRASARFDEAAEAFNAALRIDPTRIRALHGRARVALERGEPDASALYQRALTMAPNDIDLLLGLALALEADSDQGGITMLSKALDSRPTWMEGHRELARMRSEAGDRASAAQSFEAALLCRPNDPDLHIAYWDILAHLGRHEEALAAMTQAKANGLRIQSNAALLAQAVCADEAGEASMAAAVFALLDCNVPDVATAYSRHLLKGGDCERAAKLLEHHVEHTPDDIAAWAHLDLAWRMKGDDRHAWLSGQPGLVSILSIGLDVTVLAELAETLRALHRTHAHPIGQSLRGGTQTRGALLRRVDPLIRLLQGALNDAVSQHVASLPSRDSAHPLLRHRDRAMAITGSWSVRLTASGFHVSHIHPQGLLSSACYISVPPLDDPADRAGWLELGSAPQELGLPLSPLDAVQPLPGRLVLFPSYLFHGTRPFAGGERLTVAFDAVPI